MHTGALKLIRGLKPATKPGRIILRKVDDHLMIWKFGKDVPDSVFVDPQVGEIIEPDFDK